MSTTTTTATKQTEGRVTIYMSERAPLKILPSEWEFISNASEVAEGIEYFLCVREHRSGLILVYGESYQPESDTTKFLPVARAGYSLAPSERSIIPKTIRRVAGVLKNERLGAMCIEALPPEEI